MPRPVRPEGDTDDQASWKRPPAPRDGCGFAEAAGDARCEWWLVVDSSPRLPASSVCAVSFCLGFEIQTTLNNNTSGCGSYTSPHRMPSKPTRPRPRHTSRDETPENKGPPAIWETCAACIRGGRGATDAHRFPGNARCRVKHGTIPELTRFLDSLISWSSPACHARTSLSRHPALITQSTCACAKRRALTPFPHPRTLQA